MKPLNAMPVLMLADLAGHSALHKALSDAEAAQRVEACVRCMLAAIETGQGRVLQQSADEVLALFDSASEACHAALDLQQRMAERPPVHADRVGVRIGLHPAGPAPDSRASVNLVSLIRMLAQARAGETLCTAPVAEVLEAGRLVQPIKRADLPAVSENGRALPIFSLRPQASPATHAPQHAPTPRVPAAPGIANGHLGIRHQGRAFLLDAKTPRLTLGRDPACTVVLSDRKASRHHAHIEQRRDGVYFVDTSTNGSFVTLDGQQENLVRGDELRLHGRGLICLGGSANDPTAERIEFEPF